MRETTLKVLKEARKRVDQGWCQGAYAKTSLGLAVDPCDEEAVCWCLTGAMEPGFVSCYPQAIRNGYAEEFQGLCTTLGVEGRDCAPGTHLTVWNDREGRTQAEVLKLLDDTIGRIEAEATS